jgi:glycosyltransferase involved in cell wall biosynthesis
MTSITRKRILAILPALIPSTILGVIKPLFELQKQNEIEFRVVLSQFCIENCVRQADILVMCRNCNSKDLRILFWAKKYCKKIIYEIDDNFLEISIKNVLGRYHRNPVRLFVLRKIFESCDIIHVYSDSMYEIASRYNSNVKKLRSYFDFSLIDRLSRRKHHGVIKVAYSTSRVGKDSLSAIYESALRQIIQKYTHVNVFIWGSIPDRLKGLKNVKLISYQPNYDSFIRSFYQEGFDIGLAPMLDDNFHRSKTNNKFREYGGCEVAGVYSNVPLYSECVQDGLTGLLVNNTENEWLGAIERLVLDHDLRDRIRQNAKAYVANHYSFDTAVTTWFRSISQVEEIQPRNTSWNGLLCGKLKAAILLDQDSEYYMRFNPSRMNFLLEALDGLQVRKNYVMIPPNTSQKTAGLLVDELEKQHDVVVCMARDPELRGLFLKAAASSSAAICVDFGDDSLIDIDIYKNSIKNNISVISSRNIEAQRLEAIHCIRDLSPADREMYYSLDSPVCQWMELFLSLRLADPSSLLLSDYIAIIFKRLMGTLKVEFNRAFSYSVTIYRYAKQVGAVISMNFRKRY